MWYSFHVIDKNAIARVVGKHAKFDDLHPFHEPNRTEPNPISNPTQRSNRGLFLGVVSSCPIIDVQTRWRSRTKGEIATRK